MPKTVITPEMVKYILANRLRQSSNAIGKKIGVSGDAVRSYYKKNGLMPTKNESISFRVSAMTGRTTLSKQQDTYILENYLSVPSKTIAQNIGKSDTAVRTRLRQLGLIIPPEIIEQRKRDSRIKPGTTPPNKGKKQTDYMTPEQIARTVKTRFKKGTIPPNTAPADGVIRIRRDAMKDGTVKKYKWIRISIGKWKMYHVFLWEQSNGPVPTGYIIVFKDGDSMNTVVDNLEMISLAENMKRNTLHRFPEEFRHVIQLRGAINRQINKQEKKHNDEQE